MTLSQARAIFIWGTVLSALVFLALTYAKPLLAAAGTGVKSGEAAYKSQGCSDCHKIGGRGGDIGPDLTTVGKRRNRKWIEEQIVDPKKHNPDSIMPDYSNLPKKDKDDLADYLSSLK